VSAPPTNSGIRWQATLAVEVRFWLKVWPRGDCWEWRSLKIPTGYGQFRLGKKKHLAHRLAYRMTKGSPPNGLDVEHVCNHPWCVKPSHLVVVTHRDNHLRSVKVNVDRLKAMRDGLRRANAAIAVCPQGHAYTESNTYRYRGCRHCVECNRARSREYQRRKRRDELHPLLGWEAVPP